MKTKKLILLMMAAVFTLGVTELTFGAQEIKGTVAKILGNKLTLVDEMGKQINIAFTGPKALLELKVGDRVLITQVGNTVKVTKEHG